MVVVWLYNLIGFRLRSSGIASSCSSLHYEYPQGPMEGTTASSIFSFRIQETGWHSLTYPTYTSEINYIS